MGGKALLPLVPDLRRVDKKEYAAIRREVSTRIANALDLYEGNAYHIPYYEQKDSFGDMDLLMYESHLKEGWRDKVAKYLESTAVVHTPNSKVTSFEYKKFQIDIISANTAEFNFTLNYYSYNDLGNLMGKVARAMGLKLAHDGLWLRVKDGEDTVDKILITRDWYAAIGLLGFHSYNYGYGLRKMQDIYKYVIDGAYFNKEIFSLENGNSKDRSRNSKRPNYTGFLEYISDPKIKNNYDYANSTNMPWIREIKRGFPHVVEQYNYIKEKIELNRLIKKKFNGDIIKEIVNLEGEPLGVFLDAYKASFKSTNEFEQFVLASTPKSIENSIKDFASKYTVPPCPEVDKVEIGKLEELLPKKGIAPEIIPF